MLKLYCGLLAVSLYLASSKQEKSGKDCSRKDKCIEYCPKDEDDGDIKLKDLIELTCQSARFVLSHETLVLWKN